MIDCLILGDSIAVGIHKHRPECVAYAKVGINTHQWNHDYLSKDLTANTVIISLGSNDTNRVKTENELLKLRAKVDGGRVFWILPAIQPNIQRVVMDIAKQYNDTVLYIPALEPDRIHPNNKGYRKLAAATK